MHCMEKAEQQKWTELWDMINLVGLNILNAHKELTRSLGPDGITDVDELRNMGANASSLLRKANLHLMEVRICVAVLRAQHAPEEG